MAIKKLPSGSYQARLPGVDGRVLTKTFPSRLEAEEQVVAWKRDKKERKLKSRDVRLITLDDFFAEWFRAMADSITKGNDSGWRKTQLHQYRTFVHPVIGAKRLDEIRPRDIQEVLIAMAKANKAEQTRVHVFNLLRKVYSDAIETYEYVSTNPVLRKLKPKLTVKEARHLNKDQAVRLLAHVEDRKYGVAIWLQVYLGLRLGEVRGLQWEDIDLESGKLTVRRVYVRKTGNFREHPKGGKQRVHSLPSELWARLEVEKGRSNNRFVVASPRGKVLPYRWYLKALTDYCTGLGLPRIGTHGLRHSTSELYLSQGATKDDVQQLLGHSSPATTARYLHGKGSRLEDLTNVIRLFPVKENTKTEHDADSNQSEEL